MIKNMLVVSIFSFIFLIWLCWDEMSFKFCCRKIWSLILRMIALCGEGVRALDNKCSCNKPVPNIRIKSHCDLCGGNIKRWFGL